VEDVYRWAVAQRMINDACALTWEGLSWPCVPNLGPSHFKGNIGLPRRAVEMRLWLELMDFTMRWLGGENARALQLSDLALC
jgi:hypothetical protein